MPNAASGKMRDLEERLIRAVELRPELWDPLHERYRERGHSDALWSEVAAVVGMDNAKVAKTRWRNIRDVFVRARKKTRERILLAHGPDSEQQQQPQHRHHHSKATNRGGKYDHLLQFLLQFVTHRNRGTNSMQHQEENTSTSFLHDLVPIKVEPTEGGESSVVDDNQSNTAYSTDQRLPSYFDSDLQRIPTNHSNLLSNRFTLSRGENHSWSAALPDPFSTSSRSAEDVDQLFGGYIVLSLRGLSPKLRAQTRLQIQKIICDAQMKELE